jgi:predicted AlkP superfamily pyrophosphatase or phosphodiesterase
MKTLPDWVTEYNKTNRPDAYLAKPWTTLLPIEQYTESIADDNNFETILKGETRPVFPHDLPELHKKYGITIIRQTPFGNDYTADFAKAAIKNYALGSDDVTDFLCLSFSSTDIVGHAYAPQSVEVEDTYLRLDQTMADFLTYLDTNVGKNNYTLFLTADHGGVENTGYLKSLNMPSNLFDVKVLKKDLQAFLVETYKDSLLSDDVNLQIYLNDTKLKINHLDKKSVCETVAEWLRNREGINTVFTREELLNGTSGETLFANIKRGFLAMRSGDVAYTLLPSWGDWGLLGTSHGMAYPYDTHVPLLWYGKNIKHGSSSAETHVTDIAATLAQLLNIQMPSGCFAQPILPLLH